MVLEYCSRHLFGLVKDSRSTDTWLGLLGLCFYQDDKPKTTMKISNMFVGLAEESTISVEGIELSHRTPFLEW